MTTTMIFAALTSAYLTIAILSVVALWPGKRRGEKIWFIFFLSATWLIWICVLALYCLWELAKERFAK